VLSDTIVFLRAAEHRCTIATVGLFLAAPPRDIRAKPLCRHAPMTAGGAVSSDLAGMK